VVPCSVATSKVNQFSSRLTALFACTIEATPPPKGPVIEPGVEPVMDATVPTVADAEAALDVVASRPDATPPPIEAGSPPADAGIADGASPPDVTTSVDVKTDAAVAGLAPEVVRLAASAASTQADFDKYVGAGHRLVWQDGFDAGQGLAFNAIYRYPVGGGVRYALISEDQRRRVLRWQQGSASTVVRADLSEAQFATEVEQNRAKGLSTRLVTGYQMMGEPRFLGIWGQ
jgi:hypothetical protein